LSAQVSPLIEVCDALLIVSFGGPEGLKDVEPFLQNVLRGRNVPPQRMKEVAHHYELFDGVSPINQQNRKLIKALRHELDLHGPNLPIYWGNRNWHPFLADTIAQMKKDGIRNALAFVTSAYSSYSSCRQYRENISNAREPVADAPSIEKLRAFFNHPKFVEANVDRVKSALANFEKSDKVHLAFTAHSIPVTMAGGCDYEKQLAETARLVASAAGVSDWKLCYQSRSGPPTQPWLGPDICAHIEQCHHNGVRNLIISPIGFVSDHMEVIYDLDVEAKQLCDKLKISLVRAATAGTHPAFVTMIRNLVEERMYDKPRLALGQLGARSEACEMNCCPLTMVGQTIQS
jgi:ferrochelatase